jgi:small redox-active disulfide protein 2
MKLFGFTLKGEGSSKPGKGTTVTAEKTTAATEPSSTTAAVLVLGSGCAKCNALETSVKEALADLGLSDELGHVRDYGAIASFGVMSTPALVVDGKVVSYGKVLSRKEAAECIKKARNI